MKTGKMLFTFISGCVLKGFLVLFVFSSSSLFGQSLFGVKELLCEQQRNPLGIETPAPAFSWRIHAVERGFVQTAYRVLVSDNLSELERNKGNLWDSGKVKSGRSVLVSYAGKPLASARTYYWKSMVWNGKRASEWSETGTFRMGLLSAADWADARWICLERDVDSLIVTEGVHGGAGPTLGNKRIGLNRLPIFRKEFRVDKPLLRATAYVCGLGQFDLFVNGAKCGDHFLDPAWTKYDKHAQYVTFDLTRQLNEGDNCAGVMLGNGFYNIPRERYSKFIASYGYPKVIVRFVLEYADGTSESVVSDTDWRATGGPVTFSSIYGGETFDAALEPRGWMLAGFDDSEWQLSLPADFRGALHSQRTTPVTVRAEIPPARIYRNGSGNWVYDLGQNFSGVIGVSLTASGRKAVDFFPAELLRADSTANQSASGSPFYFTYITRGDGSVESWQPRFTYYGFRYVEVKGAVPAGEPNPEGLPEIVALAGLHTCNSAETIGSFECSNPLFNRIFDLIDWAIRSNFSSVFTDCPHREKLGWLEQAHLIGSSVHYTYDISRAFPKLVDDMRAAQTPDGMIPTIAPHYVKFGGGFYDTPEWGSAYVVLPWYLYRWYGDLRLLQDHYGSMVRYVDYLSSKADGHIVSYGLGDWFDIGPGSPGVSQLTSNGVTATAIYYYDVTILERVARLLGKSDDVERFGRLGVEIRRAFNARFFDRSTKRYDRNSQAANAMALYMGLVEPEYRDVVLDNLIDDIRSRGNALTAGDVGYRYVIQALADNGASVVIYDMNSRYDVPGYGYQLMKGATALTESWQAYEFVSNNHCMLGHLYEWLYGGLGGIGQSDASTAYSEVTICPQVVGDIHWTRASFVSPYGLIRSEWRSEGDRFRQLVEIPANSTALVSLPAADGAAVTENGVPVERVDGITIVSRKAGRITIRVGSGIYDFVADR